MTQTIREASCPDLFGGAKVTASITVREDRTILARLLGETSAYEVDYRVYDPVNNANFQVANSARDGEQWSVGVVRTHHNAEVAELEATSALLFEQLGADISGQPDKVISRGSVEFLRGNDILSTSYDQPVTVNSTRSWGEGDRFLDIQASDGTRTIGRLQEPYGKDEFGIVQTNDQGFLWAAKGVGRDAYEKRMTLAW